MEQGHSHKIMFYIHTRIIHRQHWALDVQVRHECLGVPREAKGAMVVGGEAGECQVVPRWHASYVLLEDRA